MFVKKSTTNQYNQLKLLTVIKKLLFCLSALFAVACTEGIDEDITLNQNTGAVNFDAVMTTRATDTAFEVGDEISVMAYNSDGTSYAENVLYSYSGTLFSSEDAIFKQSADQELSYLAVYPYATISDEKKVNFSVKEDQSIESNYTLSDLLSSSLPATTSISPQLTFEHILSKVVINIESTTDAVVTLYALTDIEYDLSNGEYTTSGESKAITMANDGDTNYKALIVPQTISANTTLGTIQVGDTSFDFSFNSDITISSGYLYTFYATIENDQVTFSSTTINNWNEVSLDEYLDNGDDDSSDYDSQYEENGVEFGEGFIVFEADAATYNPAYWTLRTPDDSEYESEVTYDSGVGPVNDNYLQYMSYNVMTVPTTDSGLEHLEATTISYTFTCRKTATYKLAARIYQPTTESDAYNDFWLSVEGNFTSGYETSCPTEALQTREKFYGRGVSKWGVANTLEFEYNGSSSTANPSYILTEGEEYTFKIAGRTKYACIDYLILYTSESPVSTAVDTDIAAMNPAYYRPNGPTTLSKYVALIDFEMMYLSGAGDTKTLEYQTYPSIALDHTVVWSSSDESVMTVDQSGNITGVSNGSAYVTARSADGYAVTENLVEVGKYIQTFDNFTGGTSYLTDNGVLWSFDATASSNTYMNETKSLSLYKNSSMTATVTDGISSIRAEYTRLYNITIARTLEVYLNGELRYSHDFSDAAQYEFELTDLNISGECTIEIKNATINSNASYNCYIAIDNLIWTPYQE
ncbi:MAG: fimbrillin family protein [Rikenellaceae bacterium]